MPKASDDAAAQPIVSHVAEGDWRAWREIRLAALADAPASFADAAGRSITEMRLELAP